MVKTHGIPSDRVTLLLNEDATREEVRLATEEAAQRVKKKAISGSSSSPTGRPRPRQMMAS
jgi:hypothetical protein